MKYLMVGDDYRLPLEMLGDSTTIFGRKRTGKSNNAAVLVEEGLGAGVQFIITDPKGDWWGLLSSADGKSAGYPLVVIGGQHATVSLNVGAGAATAAWVKRTGYSVILDLQGLEDHEIERFMSAFLKELRRLQEEDHKNIVLVVDEADELAPEDQRARLAVIKTMGLLIWFVKRGGFAGVGTICITQRPASISKNITTQSETIIVLHVSGSQDLDAVADALKHHVEGATKKERTAALENLLREIVLLDKGATIIVSAAAGLKGKIHRVQFRRRKTFDSGATPKMGELPKVPKVVAKVDLQQLSTEMQRAVAEIAENDVPTLKKRIRELEASAKIAPKNPAPTKRVEVAVIKDAQITRLEKAIGKFDALTSRFSGVTVDMRDAAKPMYDAFQQIMAARSGTPPTYAGTAQVVRPAHVGAVPVRATAPAANLHRPSTVERMTSTGTRDDAVRSGESRAPSSLGRGERKVLIAIAQYDEGVTREQLTVLTGYKRSSRDAYIQRLVSGGYAAANNGFIVPTHGGLEVLGDEYERLPTGAELGEYWLARLKGGEATILAYLMGLYPESVDRNAIDEHTEYKRSSRDAYLQRLIARKLVISVGRGAVKASEALFG